MIPLLLLLIPALGGVANFFLKNEKQAKQITVTTAMITLFIAIAACWSPNSSQWVSCNVAWLPTIGASFALKMDGLSKILCLLTGIAFPAVFLTMQKNNYSNHTRFYGLMLLSQAGLMGVFVAADALLFYFAWELALIPVYFLCSQWGGEKKVAITFKFFLYTILGSLLMLAGILYLHTQTPNASFAYTDFLALKLTNSQQSVAFWLIFIAFAIKMPIFPLHTWQPDTYEQSATGITIILSAVMVKMGVYGLLRWLIPMLPLAVATFDDVIIIISIFGMLYASIIALQQDDIKRMIAYSSIAHIGLMSAAIFSATQIGTQGAMIQMFNHGIIVIGLWIGADQIETKLGTRKLSEMGGLAKKSPKLATLFILFALANVALPLTSSFVGEFLMFNGLFQHNIGMATFALLSIILVAAYTFRMVQQIFYGEARTKALILSTSSFWVLIILVAIVLAFGVYPNGLLLLTKTGIF